MRTISFNGEFWYEDSTPLLKRIAKWFVWVGGWKIWLGSRGSEYNRLENLAPISLLGHRATYYGWGFDVRVKGGHLVVVFKRDNSGKVGGIERAYISRDGTPSEAHVWIHGAPMEIRRAAATRSKEPPGHEWVS
jgi:hypothetical protein